MSLTNNFKKKIGLLFLFLLTKVEDNFGQKKKVEDNSI